jgi:hypothetical protein
MCSSLIEINPLYVRGGTGNRLEGGCYAAHLTLTTPSESCPELPSFKLHVTRCE